MFMFLCEHKASFLWDTCPLGQLLGHVIITCLFSLNKNLLIIEAFSIIDAFVYAFILGGG